MSGMNNNTLIMGVVLAVIIVGGFILYGTRDNPTLTLSDAVPTTDTTTGAGGQTAQPGIPILVTNAQVFPTDTTVMVTGAVTPNGAFTSYWYEYGTASNFGVKTPVQSVGSGYSSISTPGYITLLTKNTTYYFQLVAENQYGKVTGAQYSFKTTIGSPPPVGSAPKVITLAANGIGRTTANLNGQVNPNKAITEYWFEYGKTTNLGNTTVLASVGDGSVLITAGASLSNLEPATTYYFRLNSQNQFGTVNGSINNFKTMGPAATTAAAPSVTTRAASTIKATTATLHATIAPNGGETTYWFEYNTDPILKGSLKSTSKKSAGTVMSPVTIEVLADISSLKGKTNYYFRAAAQNSQGLVRGDIQTFKTE